MIHKAKYFSPGSLFSEEQAVELSERSVEEAVDKAPAAAFAFVLYDLHEVDFEYDEERFTVIPKAQNQSGRYYLGGEIVTAEQIAQGAYSSTLKANVAGTYERMIHCRTGNWQPFEDGDELVEPREVPA